MIRKHIREKNEKLGECCFFLKTKRYVMVNEDNVDKAIGMFYSTPNINFIYIVEGIYSSAFKFLREFNYVESENQNSIAFLNDNNKIKRISFCNTKDDISIGEFDIIYDTDLFDFLVRQKNNEYATFCFAMMFLEYIGNPSAAATCIETIKHIPCAKNFLGSLIKVDLDQLVSAHFHGCLTATDNLGIIYYSGFDVPRCMKKAQFYFQHGFNRKSPSSMINYANMIFEGQIINKNKIDAIEIFEKCDHPSSYINMTLYYFSEGDSILVRKYALEALKFCNAVSTFNYALLQASNEKFEEAKFYFNLSHKLGSHDGALCLARIYIEQEEDKKAKQTLLGCIQRGFHKGLCFELLGDIYAKRSFQKKYLLKALRCYYNALEQDNFNVSSSIIALITNI